MSKPEQVALGQLRHAYQQAATGNIGDQLTGIHELREAIAAAQAENARLREALQDVRPFVACDECPGAGCVPPTQECEVAAAIDAALARPEKEPPMSAPDFEPLSEEEVEWMKHYRTHEPLPAADVRSMAAELLALRAALLEWHVAADMGDLERLLPAEADLRALARHIDQPRRTE